MTINVTQDDIRDGKRYRCGECPVALAIKRACGTNNVLVNRLSVIVNGGSKIPMPDAGIDFICRFDDTLPVKPFSFELPIEGAI